MIHFYIYRFLKNSAVYIIHKLKRMLAIFISRWWRCQPLWARHPGYLSGRIILNAVLMQFRLGYKELHNNESTRKKCIARSIVTNCITKEESIIRKQSSILIKESIWSFFSHGVQEFYFMGSDYTLCGRFRSKGLDIQGVKEKLCFFHCNPSLAYIAVKDLQSSQRNASVQLLQLAGIFL